MARKKSLAAPEDLSELDELVSRQEAGTVVEIMHMDGRTPLGFGILVAGPDSERAQRARSAMTREIQQVMLETELDEIDDDKRNPIELRYLAAVSIRFIGRAILDKRELEDTQDDFYKLYARFRFIRLQVDRAHADRSRFLPESGDGSSTESGAGSEASASVSQASQSEPGASSGDSQGTTNG